MRRTVFANTILAAILCGIAVPIPINGQSLDGVTPKPRQVSEEWKGLIGEYVAGTDTICILEREAQLFVATTRPEYFPLKERSEVVFRLLGPGFSGDTILVFKRAGLRAEEARFGNIPYRRINLGSEDGASFSIKPLKPVTELRAIALDSSPPVEKGEFLEPDLVELSTLDKSIKYDIRYASRNNFMSEAFYSQAKAFLQRPAAGALVRAHRWLKSRGYGLLIHDAYRPWYVTKMFWDGTPDDKKIFVADPAKGSRHNRGCAVDLSLYDLASGKPVDMTGGYDEMSFRSYPSYPGGTSLQRWHRELLRKAMEMQGFSVYEWEWWHFDYKDWRKYPIGTLTFEEILKQSK